MRTPEPMVSVIIPTFHRPDLVLRAVRSALEQTLRDLELTVVVDGRDQATCEALATLTDPRIAVVVPERHLGNADARNLGVARARAPWIAFLDDDDEWMPPKLERQLAVVANRPEARPIVTARMLARSESGTWVWPHRAPRSGEDWSEYFFCRRTPYTGEGMVVLSAILAPRQLLLEVPFTSGLPRHVDPDWLLRASRVPGVSLELTPGDEPLLIWHMELGRARITTERNWRESYAWCHSRRVLFSDRGYAAFVLHVVGSNAAAEGAWSAFFPLLGEAFERGRPAPVDLLSHVANFLVPRALQRRLAASFGAGRHAVR